MMGTLLHRLSAWVRSLQAQLLLWAILPVTLVLTGLSLTGVYTHQRDQVLAQVLAINLEAGVRQGEVVPDGEGVATWPPVSADDIPGSVFVVDSSGQVLANSDVITVETIKGTT